MEYCSPHALTLSDLADLNSQIAKTSSRTAKRDLLAKALSVAEPVERVLLIHYLCGELPQGRVGIGPAVLRDLEVPASREERGLTLGELDSQFDELNGIKGQGAKARRLELLQATLRSTTREGQKFLVRLLSGGLRQGALLGVMESAVARAAQVSTASLRRAVTLSGSLVEAALIAFSLGESGLGRVRMSLMRPLSPMLASPVGSLEEAVGKWERGWWELKLDGARVQVHRQGDRIRVFSRSLRDVTGSVPEVVELARGFPEQEFVLDGEVVAVDSKGRCLPFQETMRRFGRAGASREIRSELPLEVHFFDLLYQSGQELLDLPLEERRLRMESLVGVHAVRGCPVRSLEEAEAFMQRAIDDGYEGLMVKNSSGFYEAGRRGSHWLKLKPYHTLDLVVVAAEWGSGRRRGWLSNLHLAAPDTKSGELIMLGKTFKGLSDEILQWQTQRLLELEVDRDEYTVYVKPELVVEVAFNEFQTSAQYPGGVALRFARVKGYRVDKLVTEADSMDAVFQIYQRDRDPEIAPRAEEGKTKPGR